jgi:hypothetical protein
MQAEDPLNGEKGEGLISGADLRWCRPSNKWAGCGMAPIWHGDRLPCLLIVIVLADSGSGVRES